MIENKKINSMLGIAAKAGKVASGEFSAETKELQSKLKDAENRKNKESKNPAAFSIEEALSPKDSIERTCQALGLAK